MGGYFPKYRVIILEKFNLNLEPKFISYDIFKKELKETICVMTGKANINTVNEIIMSIEDEDFSDNYLDEGLIEEGNKIGENIELKNMDLSSSNCDLDDEDSFNNSLDKIEDIEFDKTISEFKLNTDLKHFFDNLEIEFNLEKNENKDSDNDSFENLKNKKENSKDLNFHNILNDRKVFILFSLGFDFDNNILKK